MINYIYQYTNKINQKVYIGQTNNMERRYREHKSNSFNSKSSGYNNPIHRAIRKYGLENFDVEILEELHDKNFDEVNVREEYWIKEKQSLISQHGYNIVSMGQTYWKSFLTQEEVQDIKNIISQGIPYNVIVEKYGVSKALISGINNGDVFTDNSLQYPLYHYRIDNDIYDALIEDLQYPELTFKQLAHKYGLAESTVKKFNYGMLQPGYYKGEYPIRKITPQDYKADLVIDYLLNTSLTKKQIKTIAGVSDETLRRINNGLTHKRDDLIYPLR